MLLTGALNVPGRGASTVDRGRPGRFLQVDDGRPVRAGRRPGREGKRGALTDSRLRSGAAARVQPVKVPTISLKWGIRPGDGGNLVYQVLNDSLGTIKTQRAGTAKFIFPAFPASLRSRSRHRHCASPNSRACRPLGPFPTLCVCASSPTAGYTEYQFKAPPQLQDFTETQAQAFERINKCKHRGSSSC